MASFEIEAMVRGYHIYKDVWSAVIDEEFPCKREDGNHFDPFAVAVCNGDIVIGHVPTKISSVCSLYIRRGIQIIRKFPPFENFHHTEISRYTVRHTT